MRFKVSANYNARALSKLFAIAGAIDKFSLAEGEGEVVITEFTRPVRPGSPSFHPKMQAIDVRCNDKPDSWTEGVARIIQGFRQRDPHIQYDLHPDMKGTPNIHIHIEYDTGDPI